MVVNIDIALVRAMLDTDASKRCGSEGVDCTEALTLEPDLVPVADP